MGETLARPAEPALVRRRGRRGGQQHRLGLHRSRPRRVERGDVGGPPGGHDRAGPAALGTLALPCRPGAVAHRRGPPPRGGRGGTHRETPHYTFSYFGLFFFKKKKKNFYNETMHDWRVIGGFQH